MTAEKVYDCIIMGAGPGGLQAAIYLGRFNRDVQETAVQFLNTMIRKTLELHTQEGL